MSLLIGFLTFILVVNCLFLMLLVLVQLPKKEAGAGLAFGAGAVDTLIGAGSGNALTKLTKYSAGIFLGLAVLLAILNAQRHSGSTNYLKEELSKKSATTTAPMIPPQQPATAPASGTLPGTGTLPGPTVTQPATPNAATANKADTTGPTLQLTPQPAAGTPNTTAPAAQQNATTPTATPNTPPANTGAKKQP
jgi:preprotein translocase subunit SecG